VLLNMSPVSRSGNLDKVGVGEQLFDLSDIVIIPPCGLLFSRNKHYRSSKTFIFNIREFSHIRVVHQAFQFEFAEI